MQKEEEVCVTATCSSVKQQQQQEEEDQFSKLSNEILILILSRLTIKEAARTGVLSHRWEHLWEYFTGCLDFRAPYSVIDGVVFFEEGSSSSSNYVHWVNHILNSHRGRTLDAFSVAFKLDKSKTYQQILNSWVNFAIQKGVRMLQLDFRIDPSCYGYTFPPHPELAYSSFVNLSVLNLSHVDVTDRVLTDFLSYCPLLEVLSVQCSFSLIHVKVAAGPNNSHSLKLKHLEISQCHRINSIGISAENLVSFKFSGRNNMTAPFKNFPLLSRLEIGGRYSDCLVVSDVCELLFVPISQLERLVLDLSFMNPEEVMLVFARGFPEFANLKYLELRWGLGTWYENSILFLTSIIEACPCLQTFRLEVVSYGMSSVDDEMWRRVSQRKPSEADMNHLNFVLQRDFNSTVGPNFPLESKHHQGLHYKCLEVVDLGGFLGHQAELKLATYLLENASRLVSVTVHPRTPEIPSRFWDSAKMEAARERARQLETKLPAGAKLIIL